MTEAAIVGLAERKTRTKRETKTTTTTKTTAGGCLFIILLRRGIPKSRGGPLLVLRGGLEYAWGSRPRHSHLPETAMKNMELARTFSRLADVLEIRGEAGL